SQLILMCEAHLPDTGRVAFTFSPIVNDGHVIDVLPEILRLIGDSDFVLERRVIVPFDHGRYTDEEIRAALDERTCLPIFREVILMRLSKASEPENVEVAQKGTEAECVASMREVCITS